ncbi:MAG: HlyU family transcriptional regulator [Roseicyclus sp.]
MSLLSKLFRGGAAKPAPEPELHHDFRIFPEPQSGQGGFRIGARIEKDIDGEVKTHHMIRADTCQSVEEAERVSLLKARMLIDQQGEDIFR